MPEIRPFRGYTYNQEKVPIQEVVAPPYDVISEKQQSSLYHRNPYNVVRLILGKEQDRYASAAKHFLEWQDKGILVRDKKPSIYILHQTFEGRVGKEITRRGFVALCRLEEFEKRVVLPHEKTLAKPREDRYRLLQSTHTNFSQVFSLYSDPDKRIEGLQSEILRASPDIDLLFEDVQNKLWRLSDKRAIQEIQKVLADKQVLIADGHHRYETALEYRNFLQSKNQKHSGQELYNYVMMFLTNLEDEGLVVLPTHRIVHSLRSFDGAEFMQRVSENFVVRAFKEPHALLAAMDSSSTRSYGVLVKGDPQFYLLSLKPTLTAADVVSENLPAEVKDLDVTVLHSLILKEMLGISTQAQEQKVNLEYVKSVDECIESVWKGIGQLAFLMNPTQIQEVRKVAKAGFTMPQKSTYFYPKLLSGLVINKLED
ncbi:MAG: DUF1015 domain-containing protein [Ignavibacteriales bacterium]|nr:DUF1015 domain-containing protein [Ignavibacteriales bacterium]